MLATFRLTVNQLRQPAPYFPIATEAKAIANLMLGIAQLAASQALKLSSNPRYNDGRLTRRHIEIGTEPIRRGMIDLAPSLIVISLAYVYQSREWIWMRISEIF